MTTLLCCRFEHFPLALRRGFCVENKLGTRIAARFAWRRRAALPLPPLVRSVSALVFHAHNRYVFPRMNIYHMLVKRIEFSALFGISARLSKRLGGKGGASRMAGGVYHCFLRWEHEIFRTFPMATRQLLGPLLSVSHRESPAAPRAERATAAQERRSRPELPLLYRESHAAAPRAEETSAPERQTRPALTEHELRLVTHTVYKELERQLRGESLRRGR